MRKFRFNGDFEKDKLYAGTVKIKGWNYNSRRTNQTTRK